MIIENGGKYVKLGLYHCKLAFSACLPPSISKTKGGVIMVVEKDKGISENESNPSNLLMRVRGGLTWKRVFSLGNEIKCMHAFTLKCGAIAALVIMASWGFICWALLLPNPIRALTIWGYFFLLSIPASIVHAIRTNRNASRRC